MARKNIKMAASELKLNDVVIIPSYQAKIVFIEDKPFNTYGGQTIPFFSIEAIDGPHAGKVERFLVVGSEMIEMLPRPTHLDKGMAWCGARCRDVWERVKARVSRRA